MSKKKRYLLCAIAGTSVLSLCISIMAFNKPCNMECCKRSAGMIIVESNRGIRGSMREVIIDKSKDPAMLFIKPDENIKGTMRYVKIGL